MVGEIWTYVATKPNNNLTKIRPVLVIGDDANNNLQYVDIHYVIISSSSDCGIYDVKIEENVAKEMGLARTSIIKTTKLYTGPKSKLGSKIGELPENLRSEFIQKYRLYQDSLIQNFFIKEM